MTAVRQPVVANASFVTAQLAIGGDLDPDDDLAGRQLIELVEYGLTHIVDVRIEADDRDFVTDLAPWIGYLHHGMDDVGQRVPAPWFEHGVQFVLDALTDPEAVVLTHCHMGINRGPSLGFAVLLAQGWDPIEAMDAIRRARPIAYVDYAKDALRWHHGRAGTPAQLRRDLARLRAWRRANHLDLADVIRQVRTQQRV